MEYFEFVCHAPSDYFKAKTAPYPTKPAGPEIGYIWTSLGPQIVKTPTILYGHAEPKQETKEKREKKEDKEKKDSKEKREIKEKKETVKEKVQVKEKEGKKGEVKERRTSTRDKRWKVK